MITDIEFVKDCTKSIIRYSLAQLIYINTDDSKYCKLERLNNTISGNIARQTLLSKDLIITKSTFIFDKMFMLNSSKRAEIEKVGIDTYIEIYLINEILLIVSQKQFN